MDPSTPADLLELKAQFDSWRQTHPKRSHFPHHLWQAAVALLERYPADTICSTCRLRPDSFKKRAEARAAASSPPAQPPDAFLQLHPVADGCPQGSAPPLSSPLAGRLLIERPDGARLSLCLQALDSSSINALCASFLRS
jgi:hypothetical protein